MSDPRRESLAYQLKALMDALPFATWFKDTGGRFNQVNSEFITHLTVPGQEVWGRKSHEVLHRDDARQIDEGEQDVLKWGKASQATHSRDRRIYKTVYFPVLDDRGRIIDSKSFLFLVRSSLFLSLIGGYCIQYNVGRRNFKE